MKRILVLFVAALMLFTACAFAEETENALNGIVGSNVYDVLNALEGFGIPTPVPEKTDYGYVWRSEEAVIKKVESSYVLRAMDNGEIINGLFYMNESNNGLFNIVAAMGYNSADQKTATSFIKSNVKKDATRIIGDVRFTLKPLTTVSSSSITIGRKTYSDTSKSTKYSLLIEYVDRSAVKSVAKITKGVNIRAEDNAESKKLGQAKAGDKLNVLQEYYNPKWHQVEFDGQVGYVSVNYCEIIPAQ